MLVRDDLKIGSVVRLSSGSIKFAVENVNRRGDQTDIHLLGYGDRIGIVRLIAKPEVLCWPKPAEEPRAADEIHREPAPNGPDREPSL
jgi:hypothetical protein